MEACKPQGKHENPCESYFLGHCAHAGPPVLEMLQTCMTDALDQKNGANMIKKDD